MAQNKVIVVLNASFENKKKKKNLKKKRMKTINL